jgi:hypothetical protein
MFVRWRRTKLTHLWLRDTDAADGWRRLDRYSLAAQLCRSERIDGKPRNIVVGTLAHVEERWAHRPADRFIFWQRTMHELARLGVDGDDRGRIVAALGERVHPFDDTGIFVDRDEWTRIFLLDDLVAAGVLPVIGGQLDVAEVEYRRGLCQKRQQDLQQGREGRLQLRAHVDRLVHELN